MYLLIKYVNNLQGLFEISTINNILQIHELNKVKE